jgi:crossover junction endodeoxyribonuclease RuvC
MDLIAIDPGLSGAVCFMKSGSVVDLIDAPTLPDGANRQLDIMALCRRIDKHQPTHAIIENVQPMPSIPGKDGARRGMGAASSFRFGFAVGQARALVTCYGMEVRLVHPQSWKRWAGLKGPDKEQSRQKALLLMPSAAKWLGLKKDHNKAEALLLALYLTDTLGML